MISIAYLFEFNPSDFGKAPSSKSNMSFANYAKKYIHPTYQNNKSDSTNKLKTITDKESRRLPLK